MRGAHVDDESRGRGHGRTLVTMWTACTAAFAATLVNPYGPGLWFFLSETVGLSRRFIPEWGMATGTLTTLGVWSIFALTTVVAIRRADRATRLPAIAVSAFWCLAAFKVSRLDAFFALSTIGLLAPELIQILHARRRDEAAQTSSVWRQAMVGALAVVTLVATVPLLKTNLLCIDVHAAATFPEAEAMAFVRDRQLRGRMVTFFDWGQYAIWHKPDALRVSMDGRRETVYSDRSVDLHLDMYLALDDGLAYLDSLQADYVWVPRELPLASTLMKSPAWTPAYRGGRSIIFARGGLLPPGTPVQEGAAVQCRCFPGPDGGCPGLHLSARARRAWLRRADSRGVSGAARGAARWEWSNPKRACRAARRATSTRRARGRRRREPHEAWLPP